MRLIDADAIKYTARFTDYADGRMTSDAVITKCEIDSMPTIDPVKHGRWERHYSRPNVYADLYWHCSECGYKNENQWAHRYHKYCPNCGARMDGDENE